jgi:large subunit ribosomal protein L6
LAVSRWYQFIKVWGYKMTQVQKKSPERLSRVAKQPVVIPNGVTVTLDGQCINVKGPKGELTTKVHVAVELTLKDQQDDSSGVAAIKVLMVRPRKGINQANMQAGTARANCYNMVHGVTQGFEKKLTMIGVGYRAQLQGNKLVLTVGKSHPDIFMLPEGIAADLPSQTEIIIRGIDKNLVGLSAAKIRDFRPPEPYKGKGIRYVDEYVIRKEAKK